MKWDDAGGVRNMGSGFIISGDGLVVTNAHVVERFADGAVVITLDGGDKLKVRLLCILYCTNVSRMYYVACSTAVNNVCGTSYKWYRKAAAVLLYSCSVQAEGGSIRPRSQPTKKHARQDERRQFTPDVLRVYICRVW